MEKLKLVYYDLLGAGPELLDRYFDEKQVELCEVIRPDDPEGLRIEELAGYEGWDFLIIPNISERAALLDLLEKIGIDIGRVVFFGEKELYCEEEEQINRALKDEYYSELFYSRMCSEYEKRVMGDYAVVSAEECSYLHTATDRLIMGTMFFTGRNWAQDDMWKFFRLAKKYYSFHSGQNLFCDIGANIGTTGIYFKKKIDPEIRILAFEPSPINYKMLRINMILNDLDAKDYQLANCGVSDQGGEMRFSYDAFNTGGSRILRNASQGETVSVVSFDEYVAREEIDIAAIKYLWVDVEGFEPYFIKGAIKTLKNVNVPIVTEFSPAKYRENGCFGEYIDLLKELFAGFILMQDEEEQMRKIDELYSYEDSDGLYDIFLLKTV